MNVIKKYKEFDVYFKNADHIDVKTIEGDTNLRSFISGMLSYYPWWLLSLYRIREIIVGILGLVRHEKPETLPSIQDGLSMTATGAGLVFAVFFAGRLISNLPAAWIVERFGPRVTGIFGSGLLLLGSLLAALAPFEALHLTARGIQGVGSPFWRPRACFPY